MRPLPTAIVLASLLMTVLTPVAAAHSETKHVYVAGEIGNCKDFMVCDAIPGGDLFGTVFPANGEAPVKADVTASGVSFSGGAPFMVVCQDSDANQFCGEPGEPTVSGCGMLDLTTSAVPFDPTEEVQVYLSSLGCGHLASNRFDVTITYVP